MDAHLRRKDTSVFHELAQIPPAAPDNIYYYLPLVAQANAIGQYDLALEPMRRVAGHTEA